MNLKRFLLILLISPFSIVQYDHKTIYDNAGRVVMTIALDEDGYEQPTGYKYDNAGKQIAIADASDYALQKNSSEPDYAYIESGEWYVIKDTVLNDLLDDDIETYANVSTTIYAGNRRKSVTDDRGNTTEFVYDALGRVIKTIYPLTNIDGIDQPPPGSTEPDDNFEDDATFTHIGYDGLGRKAWESVQTMQPDPEHIDLPEEDRNLKLRKKSFEYDASGRLTMVELPAVDDPQDSSNDLVPPIYRYIYDNYGNQVAQIDAKSQITIFKYNELNLQTHKYQPFLIATLPTTAEEVYGINLTDKLFEFSQYDVHGRIDRITDYENNVTVYEYTVAADGVQTGLLKAQLFYNGAAEAANLRSKIEFTYDKLGRRRTETITEFDTDGTSVTYARCYEDTYTNEGQIDSVRIYPTYADCIAGTNLIDSIGYGYNQITGQRNLVTEPHSGSPAIQVSYDYDELGRIKTAAKGSISASYTYNETGSVETITYGNGLQATYSYDALNRLDTLVWRNASSTIIASYDYDVYADGQRSKVTELDGSVTLWSYDNLNRLIEESLTGVYTNYYVYDLAGNRVEFRVGAAANYYQYNDKNQLLAESPNPDYSNPTVTYGYDLNGSLTSKTDAGGTTTYVYNLRNKLSSVTSEGITTSFTYNPDGIRTSSTQGSTTINYLIDSLNHTGYAQVFKESISSSDRIYIIGQDVIGQSELTGIKYLLYDGQGSVRQITDDTGVLISGQSFLYDAFGNLFGNPSPQTNLLYAGEQYDSALGMYNLRSRYYDPKNGLFSQSDTFMGFNSDPISLHKYLYCGANPINNIDPAGTFFSIADFVSAFSMQEDMRSMKDLKELSIKRGMEQVKDELIDAFDWRDPPPIPWVAQAAETLWISRLRMLGLNAIPLQSTAIGQHGPDLVAFGMLNGKFHLLIGEVKGMKRSRVLSSLDRLSDASMQMSANWIEMYLGRMVVEPLAKAVVEAGAGFLPPGFGDVLKKTLNDRSKFELYLLRARYYNNRMWKLRGFRLIDIGNTEVGLGSSLGTQIEQEFTVRNPAELLP